MATPSWNFDRHLRYEELTGWLRDLATAHPDLVALECYGSSYEGRDLWLVTVTDRSFGEHHTKPAHWVDASIHAVELTATVAACNLIDHLVQGHSKGDEQITEALRTRTFYVVPRVNPDGAELVLSDRPRHPRSSLRPWPRGTTDPLPGLLEEDIDGDGRILSMRVADADGGWMPHADDERLLVPVPIAGAPAGTARYRLLTEGHIVEHDGWTIPTPKPPEGLDLNRNFPAGWDTSVPGAGDHPLSEPEIDALIRAFVARPNICGAHAFHTSGGVILRPSSTRADAKLPPFDVWAWKQFGERATTLTGCPVHSVYEDFTWDPEETMSGAADDWAYEHLGLFSWTTEFWDVVLAATGEKQSTKFWYTGPTDDEALAVLRWSDQHHPSGWVDWQPFDHPQLGAVEIGGWDHMTVWTNPPDALLPAEVEGHAAAVVDQALAAPCLTIGRQRVEALDHGPGPDGRRTWQVEVGVANTGWLSTEVSAWATKNKLVRVIEATLAGEGAEVFSGPARQELGQLGGRAALRFRGNNDGTPDRALATWTVRAAEGTTLTVTVSHERAGTVAVALVCSDAEGRQGGTAKA